MIATTHVVSFGSFRLFAAERLLKKGDEPVPLGGRALDILIALVERAGEVLTRQKLISRVWPDVTVEEANLRVHIAGLRKALGDGRDGARYVVNVPGQGYCFVAPVTRSTVKRSVPPDETAATHPHRNLPARLTRIVGRDGIVSTLSAQLMMWRFVSIVGPGGIGKTTVAVSVAHMLADGFNGAVFFIDLAALTDPQLVPTAVASTLGFMIQTQDPLVGLLAFIGERKILLVLDNCEHVIDVAAPLAERVVSEAPQAHVLATSREALRVEGEHVHRLYALDCPPEDASLTATEALKYPAAQLFMERAAASGYGSELSDIEAPIVARICRSLDGIALAVELAASRTGSYGIRETAELLDNRFKLLWQGRRTARPRHRTMQAVVDWSYGLLSQDEQRSFRALGIFAGGFTVEAAAAVAMGAATAGADAIYRLADLVAKSLVVADVSGTRPRYRLLDTTRAYAFEKLSESGEREGIARCRAAYYRDLFERAEAEWEVRSTAEWIGEYGWRIDNLRAALDWAFSADGDATLGVALTAAAIPLWMQLSLLEECRGRLEKALAALRPGANRDARREMKLHAALAASLRYTRAAVSDTGAAWTKALEIAESLEDPEYQLRALWGLWFFHTTNSRHRVALDLAQRLCTLAERWPDPTDRLIGERAMSTSQHYLGDQSKARCHIERVLADYVIADARPHLIHFQIDLRVMARVFFARVLWLQGFPDEAMRAAERSVEDARAANHAISLCYALFLGACPIALSVGDLVAAEHYVSMLLDHSARFALTFWAARGRSCQGALIIKRGDVDTGLPLLRAGLDELGEARSAVFGLIELLMPEALGRAGRIAEGLAAIEEAINHSENTEERWMIAEMLRIKGELLLLQGGPTAAVTAEDHYRQALDWAARQGALFWELRAAMSLAGLLCDQGRFADAKALLQPVYDRFTEGFDTADLKKAKLLLDLRHVDSYSAVTCQ